MERPEFGAYVVGDRRTARPPPPPPVTDPVELARRARNRAQLRMLTGAAWFLGGLGLTVWSMDAHPGGQSAVFWGAMLYGAVRFYQGASIE